MEFLPILETQNGRYSVVNVSVAFIDTSRSVVMGIKNVI